MRAHRCSGEAELRPWREVRSVVMTDWPTPSRSVPTARSAWVEGERRALRPQWLAGTRVTGSAAASGGGLGMLLAPVAEAGPARRLAAAGAASCPPAPLSASSAPPCTSAAISTLSRSSFRRSGSSVPSPRCSSPPGGSAGDRRSEATWATVVTQGLLRPNAAGRGRGTPGAVRRSRRTIP